jgi:hypothetical protein
MIGRAGGARLKFFGYQLLANGRFPRYRIGR